MRKPKIYEMNKLKIGSDFKSRIFQGGMGVEVSGPKLVAAGANAGIHATLAGAGLKPYELRGAIRAAELLTNNPFGVNLMVAQDDFLDMLQVCIDERVAFVALGAGFSREALKRLKDAGIPSLTLVSSLRVALIAFRMGTYGIIIEAPDKAGGHLGIEENPITHKKEYERHLKMTIWMLLRLIVAKLRDSGFTGPIIAGGGIRGGGHIKKAFDLGADGVQMGTRFAMSEESGASEAVKQEWVKAKGTKIITSPVGLPGRVIETQKTDTLPTVNDVGRCEKCLGDCGRQYCILDVLRNTTIDGAPLEKSLIFAGSNVKFYNNILPVEQIVVNLTKQYDKACNKALAA